MIIDAEILRTIFIVLGGLLILGIYLWERIFPDEEAQGETGWQDSYRLWGTPPLIDTGSVSSYEHMGEHNVGTPKMSLWGSHPNTPLRANNANTNPYDNDELTLDSANNELKPGNLPTTGQNEPCRNSEPDDHWCIGQPKLILQLAIVAKTGESFNGADILRTVQNAGLVSDGVSTFQYLLPPSSSKQNLPLFTLASMVKPGAFPLANMEDFKTPGLLLFSQLPGSKDGGALFEKMLATAEVIAKDLGGEIQDEMRSRLNKQTIAHIHAQITEYQRQAKLAKQRGRKLR